MINWYMQLRETVNQMIIIRNPNNNCLILSCFQYWWPFYHSCVLSIICLQTFSLLCSLKKGWPNQFVYLFTYCETQMKMFNLFLFWGLSLNSTLKKKKSGGPTSEAPTLFLLTVTSLIMDIVSYMWGSMHTCIYTHIHSHTHASVVCLNLCLQHRSLISETEKWGGTTQPTSETQTQWTLFHSALWYYPHWAHSGPTHTP